MNNEISDNTYSENDYDNSHGDTQGDTFTDEDYGYFGNDEEF